MLFILIYTFKSEPHIYRLSKLTVDSFFYRFFFRFEIQFGDKDYRIKCIIGKVEITKINLKFLK